MALAISRLVSGWVARFLHGRHVLFPYVQYGGELYIFSIPKPKLTPVRTSNSFSVCIRNSGTTPHSATHHIRAFSVSWLLSLVYGVPCNASDVIGIRVTNSPISSIVANTLLRFYSTWHWASIVWTRLHQSERPSSPSQSSTVSTPVFGIYTMTGALEIHRPSTRSFAKSSDIRKSGSIMLPW